jgi:allantoin racemase
MAGIKIWWQSSTKIENYKAYKQAIEDHGRTVLSPGTKIEVHGVDQGTYDVRYHYFSFFNSSEILKNYVRAQKEGFNAIAVGCGMDPCLDEAKEILDIPILGLSETGMHIACMLGRKFAVITHSELLNLKRINTLIEKYGLASRCVSPVSFSIDMDSLASSFDNPRQVLDEFIKAARYAIKKGADVIVPGCNILNLVAVKNHLWEVDGVTVLDATGTLMKMAESAVILKRTSGFTVSRKGYFEPPQKNDINYEF